MTAARVRVVGIVSVAALALGGCGSGGSGSAGHRSSTRQQAGVETSPPNTVPAGPPNTVPATPPNTVPATPPNTGSPGGTITVPTPGPTGIQANPAAVQVIRAWSDALRHGNVEGAAHLFALPSVMINGVAANGSVSVIKIHTIAQAAAANATLPCGAKFLSADMRGRYVNALFELTGRPGPGGSDCGTGAGETARTNFVIASGRIVQWIRAPDDPGDNSGPVA
jgi:hypothetical protein